jgi:L-histidine N-alpha-methyltransferase
VREGLGRPQKEIPPKYFYDLRGSRLFDEITRLPEYYLTRAERALLEGKIAGVLDALRPGTLIELGAGSADKTRIILAGMLERRPDAAYVPIDVSAEFLDDTATRLRAELPGLRVVPVVGDVGETLRVPGTLPSPTLFAFLGSTIGNFEPPAAVALLRRIRALMRPDDRFLLGADLRKDVRVIEAAYDDARGVTAEFDLNILRVLNRELGADFVLDRFEHRAFYEPTAHRIEMHLVSRVPQRVHIPGIGEVVLARGESIRTEISCKYDRATIEGMLGEAGMRIERWITDEPPVFSLTVAAPDVSRPVGVAGTGDEPGAGGSGSAEPR